MKKLIVAAVAAVVAAVWSAVSFAEGEPFHFEGELTELMRTDGAGWWSASYQEGADNFKYFADWSHEDKLFDGKANNVSEERFIVSGWSGVPLTYKISTGYRRGAEVKLTAYEFVAPASNPGRAPASWTLEGSIDGKTWEPLDTHTDESPFSKSLECRHYELSKPFAGRWFRLAVTANAYDGFLSMQEVRLFGSVDGGGPSGISLDDCEISGFEPLYVNDSNDCSPMEAPTVVLSCGGDVLVEGTDYEVSWSNLKIGPGTLTITGLGRFAGGERSFDYTVIGDLTAYMRVNHPEWVYWSAPGMGYLTYNGTPLNLDFAFDGDVSGGDGKRCLFQKSLSSRWSANGGSIDIFYGNGMIGDAFRSGGEMIVHRYEIYQQVSSGRIFRAWTLSGTNDGEHWVELDARTGVSGIGVVLCEIVEEKRASYRRYKLTVSDGGDGSYTGLMELKLWGSIAGCEESREPTIADCDIDPIPPEERLYDGINPVEPKTVVCFGNEILTAGEDYEIAFENNHKVGKGRLILIGKGKWTGRLTYRFTITQADEVDITAAVRTADGATFRSTGTMFAGTSVTNMFDGITDVEKGPPDGRYMVAFNNSQGTIVDITYSIDPELAGKTSTFVLSGYSFVTQSSMSSRHPANWTLYGSKTGEEGSWQMLDTREDGLTATSAGGTAFRFDIPEENRGDYRHYKMTITKISGNGGYCGARELIFYGRVTNPKPGLILLLR